MLLCMGILRDNLAADIVYESRAEDPFDIERCELYTGSSVLSSGVVFLARGDELPEEIMIQESVGLICVGAPPESYKDMPLRLIILSADTNIGALVNDVSRTFFEYNTLEYELQSAVCRGSSIQHLVDIITPYFNGNEVQVGGANFKLLGRSNKVVRVCEISDIDQPDNDDLIAPEILNYFKIDPHFSQARDLKEPFIYGPSLFACRLLCANVFQNGEYICRAMVADDNKPFREYEAGLVAFFVANLQMMFDISSESNENLPNSMITDVLLSLLSGENPDEAQIETALSYRKWNSAGPFVCGRIMPSERDFFNRTMQYYCRQYNRENPGCCFVEFDRSIVCVADLSGFDGSIDALMAHFLEAFRDNDFRVSYSNNFDDLHSLHSYYIQAKIAMDVSTRRYSTRWFHKFSDVVQDYLLSKLTEELDEEFICAPEILRLYSQDRDGQSEYLRTLSVYIKKGMNTVKAAAELFIHRATMIYRLKRIEEITGVELHTLASDLYMHISLEMMLKLLYGAADSRAGTQN